MLVVVENITVCGLTKRKVFNKNHMIIVDGKQQHFKQSKGDAIEGTTFNFLLQCAWYVLIALKLFLSFTAGPGVYEFL